MADDDIEMNLKGLDQLLKAIKERPPVGKVGILGGSNTRSEGKKTLTFNEIQKITKPRGKGEAPTNASIGAVHEFGDPSRNIPQRSFLRIPISDLWTKRLVQANAFDEDVLKTVLKTGSFLTWMQKATVIAESIVVEAFTNNGYGEWKAHSAGYTNNTGMILVDTTQLKNSISSEVSQ